jgi:aminoglycoside/choline kinase family phosphotransferase
MSERDRLRADFVRRAGWGDAGERLLAGDASFRKYFRLTRPAPRPWSWTRRPPQEDVRPFVRIAGTSAGSASARPPSTAVDEDNGFLLLEDLGDDTFARVLAAGGDEAELYQRATDVLIVLQRAGPRALLPGLERLCRRGADRCRDAAAGMVSAGGERPADAR